MPDQMKEALKGAGLDQSEFDRVHLDEMIAYLRQRCSVGKKKIVDYLNGCMDSGIPIVQSPLYLVAKCYELDADPERAGARRLRCAVSEIRQLRREWGVRRGKGRPTQ